MKRLLLLLVALTLGCDDPDVSAKALDVLEHGLVSAQLRCSCEYHPSYFVGFSAQKLIDGSCLEIGATAKLWERSEAHLCGLGLSGVSEIDATHLHASPSFYDPSAPYEVDISTCCTGFNFEAFIGAE